MKCSPVLCSWDGIPSAGIKDFLAEGKEHPILSRKEVETYSNKWPSTAYEKAQLFPCMMSLGKTVNGDAWKPKNMMAILEIYVSRKLPTSWLNEFK